jgi:hypothetical protein
VTCNKLKEHGCTLAVIERLLSQPQLASVSFPLYTSFVAASASEPQSTMSSVIQSLLVKSEASDPDQISATEDDGSFCFGTLANDRTRSFLDICTNYGPRTEVGCAYSELQLDLAVVDRDTRTLVDFSLWRDRDDGSLQKGLVVTGNLSEARIGRENQRGLQRAGSPH